MKAKYKGKDFYYQKEKIYDIGVVYDECGYVHVYVYNIEYGKVKIMMYDGKEDMEKEWEIL